MEAGWVLDQFKASTQKGKEYFKNDIENGILKNIVKFNEDTNGYTIDHFFEKRYKNYKVEAAFIIISKLKMLLSTTLIQQ
jgi:hypothetical protein